MAVRSSDNELESVMAVEVRDGRITAIRGIRNPSKLAAFARRVPAP